MEQRRQVINKYVQLGLSTFRAFELAKMPRSTYYYKPKAGRKGRHPSTHTPLVNGDLVTNEQVPKGKAKVEEPGSSRRFG
jgi:hypothetical protein